MITPEQAREALEWWGRGVFDHGAAEHALRTIADMRCEYAVEVDAPEGKAYALESDDGMTYHIANPTYADWEEDRDDMEIFATRVDRDLGTTARVVRRLVSEPEVVE